MSMGAIGVCVSIAKVQRGRTRRIIRRRRWRIATSASRCFIPGDMGRYSYVLAGTRRAHTDTFGSTCHGAGRRMSRHQARRSVRGRSLIREFDERGIVIMAAGLATVAEEVPEAYKDVADVVRVVHDAGISTRVAELRPLGVIKG